MTYQEWRRTPDAHHWVTRKHPKSEQIQPSDRCWYQEWWKAPGVNYSARNSIRFFPGGVLDGIAMLDSAHPFQLWEDV